MVNEKTAGRNKMDAAVRANIRRIGWIWVLMLVIVLLVGCNKSGGGGGSFKNLLRGQRESPGRIPHL
jgi:hypothetical protein